MSAAGSVAVREATSWIGTPYRHQGRRKGVGCDCLGLILGVWRVVSGSVPQAPDAYAPDWAETGQNDAMLEAARRHLAEKPPAEAEPGDVLLFRWRPHLVAKHAGILLSGDAFIHAYQGHAVTASPLVPQWRQRIAGVFAFPRPCEGD